MQFISFGNGKNGKIPINGGAINQYATLTAAAGSPDVFTSLPVALGDFVVLWQTQGGTQDGHYELVAVASIVDSGHFKASSNVQNNYTTGAQAVTCPQYSGGVLNGTITPGQGWDGSKGGLVALCSSGPITGSGQINATGYGFRGGTGGPATSPGTTSSRSQQGESELGVGTFSLANNGTGGGGSDGSGADAGNGGAGGGYGTVGTNGAPGQTGASTGGTIIGDQTMGTLHLGGGGGGGRGEKNGSGNGGNGGIGGGAIVAFLFSFQATGGMITNGVVGNNASPITNTDGAGGGGGGAAGSIAVYILDMLLSLLQALGGGGGIGGTSGNQPPGTDGGIGGLGRIAVYCCKSEGSSNPSAYVSAGGHSFCGSAVQVISG